MKITHRSLPITKDQHQTGERLKKEQQQQKPFFSLSPLASSTYLLFFFNSSSYFEPGAYLVRQWSLPTGCSWGQISLPCWLSFSFPGNLQTMDYTSEIIFDNKAFCRGVYLLPLSLKILWLIVLLMENIQAVSFSKGEFKRLNQREEEGRYSVIDNQVNFTLASSG